MGDRIYVFVNEKFGTLRSMIIKGEPMFVAKDAATSLDYKDTDQAIRIHVDERDKMLITPKVFRQMVAESNSVNPTEFEFNSPRGLIFINLSGLFSLILSSKLEKAKEYRHWITSEILSKVHGYKDGDIIVPPNVATAPSVTASDTLSLEKKVEVLLECAKLTNLKRLRNQILREVVLILTGKKF